MGWVIERRRKSFAKHQPGDRKSTYSNADKIAGYPVDRRKCWAIIDGKLYHLRSVGSPCRRCKGEGCAACGYHGIKRQTLFKRYEVKA